MTGDEKGEEKKRPPEKRIVAIEDLIADLGLIPADVHQWLLVDNPTITKDHRKRDCIDAEYKEKYSQHPGYLEALKRSIKSQQDRYLRSLPIKTLLESRRKEMIKRYERIIGDLQVIHAKYLAQINGHGFESSISAAYLLFGRAISLLNMGCLGLKSGFYYSGSVLRDIDETLDVARYFMVAAGTPEGDSDRRKWFRLNVSPKHEKCRKTLAKHTVELLSTHPDPDVSSITVDEQLGLLKELYHKKSKYTHPTFRAIREVTGFKVGDKIEIESIDHGPPSFETSLGDLTDFFRSSIWTTTQAFHNSLLKAMPLSQEDSSYLLEMNARFLSWEETGAIPIAWR